MTVSACQTSAKQYSLLELQHLGYFLESIGVAVRDRSNRPFIEQFLTIFKKTIVPEVSGVVLEPEFTFPICDQPNGPGLALSLTVPHQSEVDPLSLPQLDPSWGVSEIRQNYGVAFLELYYHPDEVAALKKKQIVAELADHCRHENIAFFLKLVVYTPAEETFELSTFQETQLTAIQELRALPDLIVLQYPQETLACATLTTELDIPWLVSGEGYEYEQFKEVLRDCLDAGAAGASYSDVVWADIVNMREHGTSPDLNQIEKFLSTTGRDRIVELTRIINETVVEK